MSSFAEMFGLSGWTVRDAQQQGKSWCIEAETEGHRPIPHGCAEAGRAAPAWLEHNLALYPIGAQPDLDDVLDLCLDEVF